jgi:hypothetical protein
MAAVFYTYTGGDIFKTIPGDASSLVNIQTLDNLVSNDGSLAIYTSIGIVMNEIVQFFPTFDDVIHFLYFGRGLGSISVSGVLFSDCSHSIPGLQSLFSSIEAMKGQEVAVSLLGISFYALVTSSNCVIMGEPDTMAEFQITLQVTKDSLGSPT